MAVGTGEEDNELFPIWTCYELNIYLYYKYLYIKSMKLLIC